MARRPKQSYKPTDEKICQCGAVYTQEKWRMLPHPDPEMKSGVALMICSEDCEAVPLGYIVEERPKGYPWDKNRIKRQDLFFPLALIYAERHKIARELKEQQEALENK